MKALTKLYYTYTYVYTVVYLPDYDSTYEW